MIEIEHIIGFEFDFPPIVPPPTFVFLRIRVILGALNLKFELFAAAHISWRESDSLGVIFNCNSELIR